MMHLDLILIVRLMKASIKTYWDDEGFRTVTTSASFGEVQNILKDLDKDNFKYECMRIVKGWA